MHQQQTQRHHRHTGDKPENTVVTATIGIAGGDQLVQADVDHDTGHATKQDTHDLGWYNAAFTTGEFEALPEPKRLMIACLECTRTAVVDLKLAPVDDETEVIWT